MTDNKIPISSEDRAKKITGLLGLAARARRLVIGTELVCDALRRGKTGYLVVVSENASENTKKRLRNCCEYTGAQLQTIPVAPDMLGHSIGKKNASVAAVAVTDANMAKAIRNILKEGA
ncbi:MAG: ribosomal L7Ae/L30e/S12e/Gadd45 family protein [Clostridia bacterium]|nr:ribosomal L7Ae/L30e/S12e/Gadd45 family protein [Clostridia bacterium]